MVPPQPESDAHVPNSAVSAHILLRELREVARALPTGLDEVSLGARMLSDVRSKTGFDRAVVYTYGDSDRPAPLTVMGSARVRWDVAKENPLVHQVVHTRTLAVATGSFTDSAVGSRAILPLRLGDQLIGVVAMERSAGSWTAAELDNAQSTIDEAAVHLDSGRLFSEVRALATMEERRRLAREIHDGIAQEIASLGYVVDELVAEERDGEQRERIFALRGELTRIVSELRLSIFDLRSDVQPHTGLGAALSSYVRQVGASSGLTVHLVLDESTDRLSVETETELLRIAQEAITNARRHSRARNLWVTCRVNPPSAYMRVADDGRGLGSPRIDSYGLDIMRERAGRLGVDLSVRERRGGGTVIEIALGSTHDVSVRSADSDSLRKEHDRGDHDSDRG
ncbi:MAG: ATP-binding protein [Candidatus Nanopelagicales bacterium]